jgi:hypothetical protein
MANLKIEFLLVWKLMNSDSAVRRTFFVLIFLVFLTIAVYGLSDLLKESSQFSALKSAIGLSSDRSLAEIINYGFAFLSSVLFFIAFLEIGSLALLMSSIFMGFVWFDDSMSYHEMAGNWLVRKFDLGSFPGLRPQDTGEVLAWAAAALPLLAIFLLAFVRRRAGDWGIVGHFLAGLIGLIFCGIVVDLVHVAVPLRFNLVFELVEDGGEMLAITYIAWLSAAVCRNASRYYNNASQ